MDIAVNRDNGENEDKALFLSGAKDNSIKLWSFDASRGFQQRISCIATFNGHNENISGVCFAPRKRKFFTSVSQDNTLKVWAVPDSLDTLDQIINSA